MGLFGMSWVKDVDGIVGYAQSDLSLKLFTFLFILEMTGFSEGYPQEVGAQRCRLARDFCG